MTIRTKDDAFQYVNDQPKPWSYTKMYDLSKVTGDHYAHRMNHCMFFRNHEQIQFNEVAMAVWENRAALNKLDREYSKEARTFARKMMRCI